MIKETLFISDLHLHSAKRETTRRFINFLENRACGVERLYILGDLFDAWVGDDDPTPPNPKIKSSLKKLAQSGTAIYFQQGNRDFLVGDRFAAESQVTVLDEIVVIDLYGTPTLIMHGDLLCTDDIAYQAFREKSRRPEWQRNILSKPLLLRLAIARWYRIRSYFHKRNKSEAIMDVNDDTVMETLKRFNVTQLIHGHTHRPGTHDHLHDNIRAKRFVLAEWNPTGNVLCWNPKDHWFESIN